MQRSSPRAKKSSNPTNNRKCWRKMLLQGEGYALHILPTYLLLKCFLWCVFLSRELELWRGREDILGGNRNVQPASKSAIWSKSIVALIYQITHVSISTVLGFWKSLSLSCSPRWKTFPFYRQQQFSISIYTTSYVGRSAAAIRERKQLAIHPSIYLETKVMLT